MATRPWTLWRYRELLPVADFDGRVDLGEGGTPMIPLRRLAPPDVDGVDQGGGRQSNRLVQGPRPVVGSQPRP